mgnify:CR=1 FL=1
MASDATTCSTTETSWLYHPVFPESWRPHVLYSLATWINGMAFKNIHFTPSGRPVIKIAEIKGGITAQTQFTDSEYDKRYFITQGDMLFSWSGQPETSIDAFYWDGPDGWLNQHVFKVLPNDDVCAPNFLYYILKYLKPNFIGIARNKQTTGLGHVTKADMQAIQVAVPDRPTQDRITYVLGKLDARIAVNLRMNRTLEKMAAAIFKSWFIDFDPVRAKADGRDTGLPAEIAALFPDTFEDSKLGPIPKGWQVNKIGEVAEIIKGRSYKSSELQSSDVALVTLKSFLRGGGYREDGLKPYTGKYKSEQIVQSGEIVVAMTDVTQNADVIGRPAIVRPDVRHGILVASLDTSVVRPISDTVSIPFLYSLLSTEAFRAYTYAHTSGTTVLHLARDAISAFEFPCPPEQAQRAFLSLVEPFRSRQQINHRHNHRLAGLRDALLPKLMSGEIKASDVEHIAGRAV